jgi:hypothetical protein
VPDLRTRPHQRTLAPAFEGMVLEANDDATEIAGEVRDQSKLYGLLEPVRALGLDLMRLPESEGVQR